MRTIERRIGLLFAAFLLCFLVVVVRAVWLQGVQGAQLASEAAYQQTEVVSVPGLRGTLLVTAYLMGTVCGRQVAPSSMANSWRALRT